MAKLPRDADPRRVLTVPFHRAIATGTLRSILRTAGVSLEEFLSVFEIL